METSYKNLNSFFSIKLEDLKCDDDTKAYIVSVLSKYKNSLSDYSKESLTLKYAEAKFKQDFYIFDNLGSWIFFCNVICPEHLNDASIDYYNSIGQSSYFSCYNLINRKWKLYHELATNFVEISQETRFIIRKF